VTGHLGPFAPCEDCYVVAASYRTPLEIVWGGDPEETIGSVRERLTAFLAPIHEKYHVHWDCTHCGLENARNNRWCRRCGLHTRPEELTYV
jgi:hypothetical protein